MEEDTLSSCASTKIFFETVAISKIQLLDLPTAANDLGHQNRSAVLGHSFPLFFPFFRCKFPDQRQKQKHKWTMDHAYRRTAQWWSSHAHAHTHEIAHVIEFISLTLNNITHSLISIY